MIIYPLGRIIFWAQYAFITDSITDEMRVWLQTSLMRYSTKRLNVPVNWKGERRDCQFLHVHYLVYANELKSPLLKKVLDTKLSFVAVSLKLNV